MGVAFGTRRGEGPAAKLRPMLCMHIALPERVLAHRDLSDAIGRWAASSMDMEDSGKPTRSLDVLCPPFYHSPPAQALEMRATFGPYAPWAWVTPEGRPKHFGGNLGS